jgi:hypothetical protein
VPYFRIILHGDGICVHLDAGTAGATGIAAAEGQKPIIGFYTTRFVRAPDEKAAIGKAIRMVERLWSKPPWSGINHGVPPRLSIDEVQQIGTIAYLTGRPRSGHIFYNNIDAPGELLN